MCILCEILVDGYWVLVVGYVDEECVVWLVDFLIVEDLLDGFFEVFNDDIWLCKLCFGDLLLVDIKVGYVFECIFKVEVEDLVLEEVLDVSYVDIGGLSCQIEQICDVVELLFLYKELYWEYLLCLFKGVLFYGLFGCGKMLIVKVVVNLLVKKMVEVCGDDVYEVKLYFFNIKGFELLNKFVGEMECYIWLIF